MQQEARSYLYLWVALSRDFHEDWLGKNYNLEVKRTNNINEAIESVRNGGMAVASLAPGGLFSTNGHIVVFAEMKDAYDMMGNVLSAMGLKLDYVYIEKTRPEIAEALK